MYKAWIKKRSRLLIIMTALAFVCALCVLLIALKSRQLDTQRAAERWQGESETDFAQVSCFMPSNETLTMNQIYELRTAMYTKLHEASVDALAENELICDAWSCSDKLRAANGKRGGTVNAIAVGGNFFDFHPVRLLSGSYLRPDDVMHDRVLLDKNTAWLLFGGTELDGMSLTIEGVPFVVAGVFEHESDRYSKLAYEKMYSSDIENVSGDSSLGIFMSYDAYIALFPDDNKPGLSCYELIMAEPVKSFVFNSVKEKLTIKSAEIVDNSTRYSYEALKSVIKNIPSRAMRLSPAIYPYWENAARASQDACAMLLLAAMLTGIPVAVFALILIVVLLWRGKGRLENDILPRLAERGEEFIRVRERRRWEKKHKDKL